MPAYRLNHSGGQVVDVKEISPAEADRISHLEENHYVDLKSIDVMPGKLSRDPSQPSQIRQAASYRWD